MAKREALQLSDFLEQKAGDHLRSILYYDENKYTLIYMRNDVEEEYTEEAVEEAAEEIFWDAFSVPRQESLYPHGELNCTIRCFENAVEMHFFHGDLTGTAVAMDAQVVEDLYSFVGDCLTVIRSQEGD